MSDSDKAYIGIAACGCVTFAMVAGRESERSERAQLRRVMNTGRRVEVTTAGEARERLTFNCQHAPPIEDINAELDRLLAS